MAFFFGSPLTRRRAGSNNDFKASVNLSVCSVQIDRLCRAATRCQPSRGRFGGRSHRRCVASELINLRRYERLIEADRSSGNHGKTASDSRAKLEADAMESLKAKDGPCQEWFFRGSAS
jgi:hypothetical protein